MIDKGIEVQRYIDKCEFSDCVVSVEGGSVIYKEDGDVEELHGTVVDRILQFMDEDLPIQPLINFVKKSLQNPSYRSIEELYDFLEHRSLPVCEDGDFLAYKAVQSDYMDKYKGTFDNTPGLTVEMKRRKVDDDRSHGCSNGLHAGTLEYVQSYGAGSDKCVIVKINPADVVSVPLDCSCQKLRTSKYFVLKDYDGELNFYLADDEGEEWDEVEDDGYYGCDEIEDDEDYYEEDNYSFF